MDLFSGSNTRKYFPALNTYLTETGNSLSCVIRELEIEGIEYVLAMKGL